MITADQIDSARLLKDLLNSNWHSQCDIILDYMPPYPFKDTKPSCVVRHTNSEGVQRFLRYSKGPAQGYFWDIGGDDFLRPSLAVKALMNAQEPSTYLVW